METTNLPQTNSNQNLPTFSLASTNQIAKAIQGFGPDYAEQVLCRYHRPKGLREAVESGSPTFHDVSDYFTENGTRFWLRLHIAETFAFLGIYDTASKYQVQQTADLILSHEIYGQLTLSEFLCFLQRFKMGLYGKIYQSARPNPQEFLMCLQPFWQDLSRERIRQQEQSRSPKQPTGDPRDFMTYEEWMEIKTITAMYNPEYTVT